MVHQNSQTVEFWWKKIEGNLRRTNTEHYIILNNGILKYNSLIYDIMSVLGLDLENTVKYNPVPSGVPSGFALWNSFRQRVISLVSS